MFETISWVKPDKSTTQITVDVKEDRLGIEFETGLSIKVDHLVRRAGVAYRVYEVLGYTVEGYDEPRPPWKVRCWVNKERT